MNRFKTWGAGLALAALAGCGGGETEVSAYEGMTEEQIAETQKAQADAIAQRDAMLQQTRQQMQRLADQANQQSNRAQ